MRCTFRRLSLDRCGPQVAAHDCEQLGLHQGGNRHELLPVDADDSVVVVVESGDVDSLEVEALGDAVLDDVADPVVDARANPLEPSDLRGVGESAAVELLHADGRDRALTGGVSAVANHAAEVTGLVDESPVGLSTLLPPDRDGRVDGLESAGGLAGDDALGVEHDTQVVRGGECSQVDEQVVLGLEYAGDPGQPGSFDQRCFGPPSAKVDGVVRFVCPAQVAQVSAARPRRPGSLSGCQPGMLA